MRISVKLALMILAPVVVLIYFAGLSFIEETDTADEARNVAEIVDLSVKIGDFVHASQEELGRTVIFLSSFGALYQAELPAQRAQTDIEIRELREALTQIDRNQFPPEFNAELERALLQLNDLLIFRGQVDRLGVSSVNAIEFYTNMHNRFVNTISLIPTATSDADIARLATGYSLFLRLKERASLERALFGRIFVGSGALGRSELDQVIAVVAERDALTEAFLNTVPEEEVAIFNSTIQGAVVQDVDRLIQIAFDGAAEGLFEIDPDEWFTAITAKIDLFKQIEDIQAINLVTEAEAQEEQAQTTLFNVTAIRAGSIAIAIALGIIILRGITGQVNNITGLFSQVGIGNFDARAEVTSGDELGQLTNNLNAMLDTVLSLIQTQEERDALQASIIRLLEEVSGVGEGDLTVEAEVTADATGAIADSFNYMIDQLRQIISNVQNTTVEVSQTASEVRMTAETLSERGETQATEIISTTAAVDEMAISIQQVSENAAVSADVAEQARLNAQNGAVVVREMIDGMTRIRDQVQETSKRIKRLGERSQEIGEIVQLIRDIAKRTSILALNASLEAAAAGEAGRGFAVVAEDVKRLSERSTNATRQIAHLIQTIQEETNEAVASMEEGTREVVEGSQLADQAGSALTEIENVSNQLAELIRSISQASRQQARGSEVVALSMDGIAQMTREMSDSTKLAAVSISNLAVMADDLRGSVSAFKLPAANGHDQ